MARTSHRVVGQFTVFDPEDGTVVLEPESEGRGFWTGCPGVLHEPDAGRFLLTYRQRRPRGHIDGDRGWRCAVAESSDGVTFRDVWEVRKDELDSASMERFCLLPTADGYALYVSYVDPADNRWRIDVVEAPAPEAFDIRRARAALTAEHTGTEGVKDPYALRIGPAVYLFAGYAAFETLDPDRHGEAHETGDIYNTGLTTHPTGYATSLDGVNFSWQGQVLAVGTEWDRYQARLNSMVPLGDRQGWLGFYDGSGDVRENYEERCGLVYSADLVRWTRLTPDAPWLVSPHGTGSLRYVDALPVDNELWVYYEYARRDGAHELRLNRIRM